MTKPRGRLYLSDIKRQDKARKRASVRMTSSVDEVLEVMETSPAIPFVHSRRNDEGRTARVGSLASRAEIDALVEEWGVLRYKIQNWSRLTSVERLDALASWLLQADESAQTHLHRRHADFLTLHRSRRIYGHEFPMDPDRVEWVWNEISHSMTLYGQPSPAVHHGTAPETFHSLLARADSDRQIQQFKDERVTLRLMTLERKAGAA